MIDVLIKKLSDAAFMPAKGTPGAIAYDVFTPRDFTVRPGRQVLPLDLAFDIPYGYEAKIEQRSGYSAKGMAGVADGKPRRFDADVLTGKIDSDYRGNVGVIILSRETAGFVIEAGTPVAQLTFYRGEDAEFTVTDRLTETERGEGGFGHTSDR